MKKRANCTERKSSFETQFHCRFFISKSSETKCENTKKKLKKKQCIKLTLYGQISLMRPFSQVIEIWKIRFNKFVLF